MMPVIEAGASLSHLPHRAARLIRQSQHEGKRAVQPRHVSPVQPADSRADPLPPDRHGLVGHDLGSLPQTVCPRRFDSAVLASLRRTRAVTNGRRMAHGESTWLSRRRWGCRSSERAEHARFPKTAGQDGRVDGVLRRRAFGKLFEEAPRIVLATVLEQHLDPRVGDVGYRGLRSDLAESGEHGFGRLQLFPFGMEPDHLHRQYRRARVRPP